MQDAQTKPRKKSAKSVKFHTGERLKGSKLPAKATSEPTGYRICRTSKATGKVVAVGSELLTLAESEALANEFNMEILAVGFQVKPGTRVLKLRKAITDRLQEIREMKAEPLPATSPRLKTWAVVHEGEMLIQTPNCGTAVEYITENKLPTSSLFQSSNVADILANMNPSAEVTPKAEASKPAGDTTVEIHIVTIGNEFVMANSKRTEVDAYCRQYNKLRPETVPAAVLKTIDVDPFADVSLAVYVVADSEKVIKATESKQEAELYRNTFNEFHAGSGRTATILETSVLVTIPTT
jgi:hypothetical protein